MVVIFDEKFPKKIKDHVCDAVVFFCDHLISKKLEKYITLELEMKVTKDHGECEVIDYNSQKKPRHFKITLKKKKSLKATIKTLAHEMVHVKQFARGELSEFHDVWDGVDHSCTPYFDQPWEIEARTLEHILFDMYKEKIPKELQ